MRTPPTALEIPPALLAKLETHARASYPEECCGMLVGKAGSAESQGEARVVTVWPAANVAPGDRSRSYAIAAEDLLRAYKRARSRGTEVIGYYHSHTDASATPSARDLASATPGVSYVIVSIHEKGVLEHRSWRLRSDNSGFEEEPIV